MNQDVISFIPASFGSFVALIFIFGVLGSVIHFVPLYQSRFWHVVRDYSGQKLWDEKIRAQGIERLRFSRNFLFGRPITQSDVEQPSA
jgi:hypothetical protein